MTKLASFFERGTTPASHIRRYTLAGLALVFGMLGGIGVWAATTEISGAVIAIGRVVVETSVKKVQHPTGGVVSEILVKEGDRVKAGELLLRLDATVTRANLMMISQQVDALLVREARLKAERDGEFDVVPPASLAGRVNDPATADMIAGERSLFKSRRQVREGEKAGLRERIAQLRQEHAGTTGQIDAKVKGLDLVGKELVGLEALEAKRLVTAQKMLSLRSELAKLEGERDELRAKAAQINGRIAEIELEILKIDHEFMTDVAQQLRETEGKRADAIERRVAAEDALSRVEIRAPQSGVVHQLAVHTVAGVIEAGETLMLVVPESDKLIVEARVSPQDIDQASRSGDAVIRFAAFNQRTTPEVKGLLQSISADLAHDERTGEPYYLARITIPETELERLAANRLIPGMPAEVHIRTGARTALSFLVKPLEDQLARAFTER